jgi:hypothetical protein
MCRNDSFVRWADRELNETERSAYADDLKSIERVRTQLSETIDPTRNDAQGQ